ncbi:hypothetical protein D3C77_445730 [compost metagenome]
MSLMLRRMTARRRKFMIGLGIGLGGMLMVVGMIMGALVMLGNMGEDGHLILQVPADYKHQDIAFVLTKLLKEG